MTETANIHGTDGDNLTVVLPGTAYEDSCRELIALRVKYGADSPIGHRCSNIIELLGNWTRHAPNGNPLIAGMLANSMADLAKLMRTNQ